MATVRQRRACRIDGSGFYCGMLHEGYTEESSDNMLKVGEVGEELPDGVYGYAVERVVSSRQRGSVHYQKLRTSGCNFRILIKLVSVYSPQLMYYPYWKMNFYPPSWLT